MWCEGCVNGDCLVGVISLFFFFFVARISFFANVCFLLFDSICSFFPFLFGFEVLGLLLFLDVFVFVLR